ncbi:ABC transporter substrate-binding protein [Teichococcus oryzae]|uniref:Hopanoid biosynthesis protein HpnM n=1 Tax=Teichococcus oryzae TaxID=1608942 RepID=A0A5B2TEG3_9PROT|nr:ABC transporter substrate-binding protein [Pseudoroseomonas oryzae]KAA2212504.1 hopanoid biosynthesis protein HpnM [Pseudoroseomonas oryzae]
MHRFRTHPRPTRRLLLAGAILAATAQPAPAQASPEAVVERFHEALLGIMRQARQLGPRGRFERLQPAMQAAFDLPAMTRIAIGPPWSRMEAAQQQALVQAFSDWSVATYASRFDGFSGESFRTTGQSTLRNNDRMVQTALDRPGNDPVQLNYLLRQSGGAWRIVDIYLTGSISELASRRADFARVLAEGGADRLIAELRQRTARLLAG